MKCTIPEISWHNREPVLSVDIHPISSNFYRLATSGGDSHVLIWQMSLSENGAVKQELISDLSRHQRAVNVIRWSHSGQYLASADDDANIIIWQQKTDNVPLLEGDTGDKEIWIVYKILRGHKEDIYDLCWSVDDSKLLSGSIDNTAILWDLSKGKMSHILSDHKGFVQGVAWDPKDQLIATISTDRVCRIFTTNGKHVKARIHKGRLPVLPEHFLYDKEVKYFHDDTFKSFFRRLQFSPDGSFLVVPSGYIEADDCKKTFNATLIFTLDNFSEPTAVLPMKKQSSTAVRFCPILFELHDDGPDPTVGLPYRMIFAVGTDHDVILYDTQQSAPFARFQDIHYTRLTDLAWSSDGRILVASSTDGFCALITFEDGELGTPYIKDESETEDNPLDVSGCEELEKEEIGKEAAAEKEKERKRPSFIEQWAIKTPKRAKLDDGRKNARKEVTEVVEILDDDEGGADELSDEIREEIKKLIPSKAASQAENSKRNGDKSVAKPIVVRRKPKPDHVKEVAKPIEVRRKPKEVGKEFKENKPLNESVTKTKVENSNPDVSETKKTNLDERSAIKEISEKTHLINNDEIIEIDDIQPDDRHDKNKESKTQRKDVNHKIKVSSLAKNKTTPKKSNPLLKFLQSSAEKRKKRVGKEVSECVDLTLAEEEARDAWKCEKDDVSDSKPKPDVEPMEEDCTEDFSLQLEDTQEAEKKNDDRTTKSSEENKHEAATREKAVAVSAGSEVGDSSLKATTVGSKMVKKVQRRITPITLESPKGKKKQKI